MNSSSTLLQCARLASTYSAACPKAPAAAALKRALRNTPAMQRGFVSTALRSVTPSKGVEAAKVTTASGMEDYPPAEGPLILVTLVCLTPLAAQTAMCKSWLLFTYPLLTLGVQRTLDCRLATRSWVGPMQLCRELPHAYVYSKHKLRTLASLSMANKVCVVTYVLSTCCLLTRSMWRQRRRARNWQHVCPYLCGVGFQCYRHLGSGPNASRGSGYRFGELVRRARCSSFRLSLACLKCL
jgi:hypothetical protein